MKEQKEPVVSAKHSNLKLNASPDINISPDMSFSFWKSSREGNNITIINNTSTPTMEDSTEVESSSVGVIRHRNNDCNIL